MGLRKLQQRKLEVMRVSFSLVNGVLFKKIPALGSSKQIPNNCQNNADDNAGDNRKYKREII